MDVREDEGGIGGTGISAEGGVGIIGTITGFGSICVGGTEIHYDERSAVRVDAEPASADRLRVGQVVEVVASGTGAELAAESISVDHVVAGPVTRVDAEHNRLEVIGQTVALSAGSRSDADDGERTVVAADFSPGTAVAVSGLRRADGVIAASLIARDTRGLARLSGPVTEAEAGRLVVAGTPVSAAVDASIARGDEVRIAGRWDGQQLVAASAERLPPVPFAGRVARVEIEAYANRETTGALRVGAFVVELPRDRAAEMLRGIAANAPVRIDAVVQGFRVIAERIAPPVDLPPIPDPGDAVDRWQGDPGARQHRGGGGPDVRGNPAPRDGRGPIGNRPELVGARPDRPDRPALAVPDRPPRIERPPRPERPAIPDRPPRPDRPEIPRRP